MAAHWKIEWIRATWNPVTGCTKVSPGCKNCYAERLAGRLQAMGNRSYAHNFEVTLHPRLLELPLRWKAPRSISVNSMSVHLRRVGARVRFLSLEPILGPIPHLDLKGIDWVIVGGESRPGQDDALAMGFEHSRSMLGSQRAFLFQTVGWLQQVQSRKLTRRACLGSNSLNLSLRSLPG